MKTGCLATRTWGASSRALPTTVLSAKHALTTGGSVISLVPVCRKRPVWNMSDLGWVDRAPLLTNSENRTQRP